MAIEGEAVFTVIVDGEEPDLEPFIFATREVAQEYADLFEGAHVNEQLLHGQDTVEEARYEIEADRA